MGTKSDFAQKLLNDLRLRKERMAAAQNLDAHGTSRQNFKGSREMKTLNTMGPKIGSTYKSSSTTQKSLATVQATNQIVPYGRGHHHSSTPLVYTFNNGEKFKRLDFTSNGAMMSFLQQIGKRSPMQQNFNMQWQSTNKFPALTHLHIDEIAKGAQKLNQILRACSNGLNIDKGSIEIGQELWKGAMELEQSLRMLVSLQEASENMANPKSKSRLKLLDESEDSEDDNIVDMEKEKKIERPIFSFDKLSKNTKGTVNSGLQQKLMALTYLKEAPNSKPENQVPMTSKKSTSHRRSASCGPQFQTSQQTNYSKSNVIAKLMGLEELQHNVNSKASTESQMISKQRSSSSRSAEFKTEYTKNAKVQVKEKGVESDKIMILTSHKLELQEKTYRWTHDGHYRTTAEQHKPRWNGNQNHVIESQEAIFRINELQSPIIQLNPSDGKRTEGTNEKRVSGTQQKQREVKGDIEKLQRVVPVKQRSSDKKQGDMLRKWNTRETGKTATEKPLLHQQKQKSEERIQEKARYKSELRKTEGSTKRSKSSQNVVSDVQKLQRNTGKIGSHRKTNEVITKTMKTATKTTLKPRASIPHGLNKKQPDNMSNSQERKPANAEQSSPLMYEDFQHKLDVQQMITTDYPIRDELQSIEELVALPPSDRIKYTTSILFNDQQDQQSVPDEVQGVKHQRTTDGYKDRRDISCDLQQEQHKPTKIEKQEPLTADEIYLKQKLIKSQLFLNTAEAFFKLNIPIGILTHASDQICHDKDSKIILDCGYEVLKRKGRRQEISFNKITSCTKIRSLDELVRQLHKDFETLRSYGKDGRDEYDDARYLLKMLERDINYMNPDVNCMWDLGWNEMMFSYVEMDEVIRDVEQDVIDALVKEITEDCK